VDNKMSESMLHLMKLYPQPALGRIPPVSLSRQLRGPAFALNKKKTCTGSEGWTYDVDE
jgi:hypothetical protein